MKLFKTFPSISILLLTLALSASPKGVYTQTIQSDKDSTYQNFNNNRRANPKEAYRIAQEYLRQYGSDKDANTGTIKEWVTAYEAVVGRVGNDASKPQPSSTTVTNASSAIYAPFSEINGTTWQVKGEENGKKWATIVSFSAGGRLQYENYAANGTSTLFKGTWRQLDSDIFGTLLGPDGNTVGTITGQALNGVLEGVLKWSDDAEWRFALESESIPNQRKLAETKRWTQIENAQDAQEIRDYLFAFPNSPFAIVAQRKLSELITNPPANPISSQVKTGASDPQVESKAWSAIAKSSNVADIQVYLSYFPTGNNSSKAREKIASFDDAEWQRTEKGADEKDYQRYLEKNPNGRYASTAKERIASIKESEIEWLRIRSSNNIEDFRSFLAKYPYGKKADLAKERVNPPRVGTMKSNSIGMKFMYIPPGSYMMGSKENSEKPVHQVTISTGFWMGKYEVTQTQWESVLGSNPSIYRGCGDCPVDSVSWDDAKAFIAQLNEKNDGYLYSLPTEAEWEYAARAGTAGDYYGSLDDIAWYDKNSGLKTQPVGQKMANTFGLHDMLGNVWERCEDYHKDNYKGLSGDGSANLTIGEQKYRVLRGGSYVNEGSYIRLAVRGVFYPGRTRLDIIGFRIVARAK